MMDSRPFNLSSGAGDVAALRLAPIVTRASAGDAGAFGEIIHETRGLVCAIALAVTRDITTSEDVAQDVFLDAWRGLSRLRNPMSFLPWLRELTRNKARMAVRSAMRRRARVATAGDMLDDAVIAATADATPDALEQLVNAEARALLAESLAAVPESAREVLVLFYREGQSARQVAELLGTTEDAVRQRLARARKTLRTEYLVRTGESIARSAPGAAFVASVSAAVAAAVSAATPGVAAAATLAGSHVAAKSGITAKVALSTGVGATLTAAATGMFAGVAGGLMSVSHRVRQLRALAESDEERRAIRQYGLLQVAGVIGFVGVMVFAPHAIPITVAYVAALTGCWWLETVLLRRITERRRTTEDARDPAGASDRAARHARAKWIGFAVAAIGGGVPIALLWWRELSR